MSDSIKNALGKDKITSAVAGILGGTPGLKDRQRAAEEPGGSVSTAVKATAA
jgi:hypothetical protein